MKARDRGYVQSGRRDEVIRIFQTFYCIHVHCMYKTGELSEPEKL